MSVSREDVSRLAAPKCPKEGRNKDGRHQKPEKSPGVEVMMQFGLAVMRNVIPSEALEHLSRYNRVTAFHFPNGIYGKGQRSPQPQQKQRNHQRLLHVLPPSFAAKSSNRLTVWSMCTIL